MIGKDDMTLHGWRQLIEWSLEHSRMSDDERAEVKKKWQDRWDEFLRWMNTKYGCVLEEAEPVGGNKL